MSMNGKDPDAHQLAQVIARATGQGMNRVVTNAPRERSAQLKNREAERPSENSWRSPTGLQPI